MNSEPAAEQNPDFDEMDVLVVDAHSAQRTHIVNLLRADGYRVGEAQDGFDAFQQIKSKHIGAILLDPDVPEWDGFDLLENLVGIGCPPVVMLRAARSPLGAVAGGSEIGADGLPTRMSSALPSLVAIALEAGGWQAPLHRLASSTTGEHFDRVSD